MTDQELQRLIERISIESFQVPFRHTASFNSRLRSTGGRYMLETHNIEINPHIADNYPSGILVEVIKHLSLAFKSSRLPAPGSRL